MQTQGESGLILTTPTQCHLQKTLVNLSVLPHPSKRWAGVWYPGLCTRHEGGNQMKMWKTAARKTEAKEAWNQSRW